MYINCIQKVASKFHDLFNFFRVMDGMCGMLILGLASMVLLSSCKDNENKSDQNSTSKMTQVKDSVQAIKWYNPETAVEEASKQGKDLFVFLKTPWCPLCKKLHNTTFKNQNVIEALNQHFVSVMINAEDGKDIKWNGKTYSNPQYDNSKKQNEKNSYNQIVYELQVESIPSMLVMDKSLNTLQQIQGYKEFDKLLFLLADATGRFNYKLN